VRIASVERHLRDLLVGNDMANGRGAGFHEGSVGLNFHLLGNLTDLKDDVDFRTLIDLENNSCLNERLETRQFRLKHVRAGRQTGKDVVPSFVRDRRSLRARRGLGRGNLDTRQHGAARVLDSAADLSGQHLRPGRSTRQRQNKKCSQ